ncbi:MAG TPA: Fe-S cluster assembly protein SufD [Thermoanaerobaculia bacterium]|nr:Fe-S cluster assembly protein SufD [Thermoanaerobaculia bacterium]
MEAIAQDARTALERSVLDAFRESRSPRDPEWLSNVRRAGLDRFREAGFPTARDEAWKYTNVAPILKVPFAPAAEAGPRRLPDLDTAHQPARSGTQLVFVNGRYAAELSSGATSGEGIEIASLREVLATRPESVEPHLARVAREGNAFADVNSALVEDGAFVRIAAGAVLADPIHLLFLSEPDFGPTVSHPRNIVVAEPGSQAVVVESWLGAAGAQYLTNAVTEVVLGEGAVLDFYKVERESVGAFHVATMEVLQKRDSTFTSHSVTLGGALVRNDLNVRLDAPGASCTLNGLFLGSGTQHLDNHTKIDHAQPHGTSRELYKGIMSGKSRGVFNGKIIVRPDAQKTDAMQTNKNLLLSKEALVNSEPALEIFADDVKCRHGSTIGQLDETALFYLRSRGIGEDESRALLVYAFASDVASRIRVAPLRAMVERHLGLRLSAGDGVDLSGARA